MPKQVKMCIDKVGSKSQRERALKKSIAHNPENAPSGKLAALSQWLWRPGSKITVGFMGGDPEIHRKVEAVAHQWSEYANIKFLFGDFPKAHIRISFDMEDGSWSHHGTYALIIPRNRATMNYGWLDADTSDDEYQRVVLHEFGHALGCVHEHQHPDAGIPWNKKAVYKYYAKQDWTRADVDSNLFGRYAKDSTISGIYDRDSIMHYPIDKELTIGGYEVGWNDKLSEEDKSIIASLYPRR